MAIRHYKLVLTAIGPVHIGDGGSYSGKDYFKLNEKRVAVLDAKRFVAGLSPGQLEEYCTFLTTTDSGSSLQGYLDRHAGLKAHASKCVAYQVDMTLAKARRGTDQYYEVARFVKDGQGCPYVPGSSVKGMLRTAILTHLIPGNRASYEGLYDPAAARDRRRRATACKGVEREAFRRERPDSSDDRVVNDIMRYVSVSDSVPLTTDDLVFVKKYDKFSRHDSADHKLPMGSISRDPEYYEGNALNIYRECLKPGTRIELSLDVDERIDGYLDGFKLDGKGIVSALASAYELYSRCFLDAFDLDVAAGARNDDSAPDDGHAVPITRQVTCYLGGGIDFDSKTVINALFGNSNDGLREIAGILYSQFPTRLDTSLHKELQREVRAAGYSPIAMKAKRRRGGKLIKGKVDHRHWMDEQLGVSPHTVKLGIIGTKRYPMGKCSLTIEES